ncbi:MAG TPA: peptide chain release factor N(5)-glutamine methyltransferase [Tenericutes bacterium]|nr:peptide chain release factor N(5)-glutamine methyltransferase [Mycoplasmatota bacterium]
MTDIEYLKKYLPSEYLEQGLKRLKQGEPVQYIVGNVNFYGLELKVNKNVLIPRFETEELVYKTINYIKETYGNEKISIVDLGTGSGCIAISLKKKLDNCIITAVDISSSALDVAKENALINECEVNLIQGDMLSPLNEKYDVIISNPPYIEYCDDTVMDIVKNNEPNIALYAPDNGLYFYKEIINNSDKYLKDKFIICFEIGCEQGKAVEKLAQKKYPNSKIYIEKDMQNRDRYVFIFSQ